MRNPAWVAAVLLSALSCKSWFDEATPNRSEPAVATPCPQQRIMYALLADLDRCERQLAKVNQLPKAALKIQNRAKRCADEGPVIVPISTTKCSPGQLCLDTKAQFDFIRNRLAYEVWVEKVKECEKNDD